MIALGRHVIAELSNCNPDILADLEKVQQSMIKAAKLAGAQVREVAFHRFQPQGISGVIVIAESHLSIHTWPELGYAAVDIYTCGNTTDPESAIPFLQKELDCKTLQVTIMQRGLPAPGGAFTHVMTIQEEETSLAS